MGQALPFLLFLPLLQGTVPWHRTLSPLGTGGSHVQGSAQRFPYEGEEQEERIT